MTTRHLFMASLLLLSAAPGCGRTEESPVTFAPTAPSLPATPLRKIGQQRSGNYVVTLLNETGTVRRGPNRFVLEVRDATSNALVAVEGVHIESQVEMPGRRPMIGGGAAVQGDTPGRYQIGSNFAEQSPVGDAYPSQSAGRMAGNLEAPCQL